MSINENYKQKIISLISAILPHAKIYLFGSRAKGNYHETSDIDIAIDNKQKIDRKIISQVKNAIDAFNIPYTIDIVDLNDVSETLKKQLERDKILWN